MVSYFTINLFGEVLHVVDSWCCMDSLLESVSFRCIFVGETSLVTSCAEQALAKGHAVYCIISSDSHVKNWALKNDVPWFVSLDEASSFAFGQKIDYLFSIINHQIIPKIWLELPTHFAINYHDALLPRYAGVHATAWAILKNEQTHGITWHEVVETVDAGAVFKQKTFPVSADDTTVTLNLKAYLAAQTTFSELLDELSSGMAPVPQDLSKRSYYGRFEKPVGNGWLNWAEPSSTLYTLFRALQFGQYSNRFSSLKWIIDNQLYVVTGLSETEIQSFDAPGVVQTFSEAGLRIATGTYDVLITKVLDVTGKPYSLEALVQRHQLVPGLQLTLSSVNKAHFFQQLSSNLSVSEAFWVKQLSQFKATVLPLHERSTAPLKRMASIQVEQAFRQYVSPLSNEAKLLTLCLVYLSRVSDNPEVGVLLKETQPVLVPLVSPFKPFALTLDMQAPFDAAVKVVEAKFKFLQEKSLPLNDVCTRYPQIKGYDCTACYGVVIGDDMTISELDMPLVFQISADGARLDVWARETLQTAHLETLMQSVASHPSKPLSQLNLLSKQEESALLRHATMSVRKNQIEGKALTLNQWVEQFAETTPYAIAVWVNGASFSYAVLNQEANQLAHVLSNRVRQGDVVGVCTASGFEAYVAFLATLKLGAAFLPLNASDPISRIRFMLDDAGVQCVLVDAATKQKLPALDTKVVTISESKSDICANLERLSTPEDLAYVMYTSGTTGEPKGVQVTHQGIVNLVKETNYVRFMPEDRVLQASKLIFDASTFEVWGALLNGAASYVIDRDILFDPPKLKAFLQKNAITIAYLTAGLFNEISSRDDSVFASLKALYVGGEPAKPRLVKQVLAKGSSEFSVTNGYGPTESTTFSTFYKMSEPADVEATIPVGQPISGAACYILDSAQNLLPFGMVGELYISGPGVALGYLNQGTRTKASFIPNRFASHKTNHATLYRTGDLAYYLPSGDLKLLGRTDKQLKLRGYRIELQALESVLLGCDGVRQAVVVIHTEKSWLVAYYVLEKGSTVSKALIAKHLKQHLPAYMLPSFLVPLDVIPLTINGKVSEAELPTPTAEDKLTESQHVPSRAKTEIEQNILSIWMEVLQVDAIGLEDNFFDVGGNSLLLMQLHQRLEAFFNQEIAFSTLFSTPTIQDLAKQFSKQQDEVVGSSRVARAKLRARKRREIV